MTSMTIYISHEDEDLTLDVDFTIEEPEPEVGLFFQVYEVNEVDFYTEYSRPIPLLINKDFWERIETYIMENWSDE